MNKIILALDSDLKSALQISKELKGHIYGLKIGTLLNQIGIQGLKEFDAMNIPLFIDQKWSDLPSAVARHIENFKNFKNIEFMTIHSLSSKAMIKEAVKAAKNINNKIKIMAVTIPTSTENLKEIGINNSLEDQVKKLVMLSHECGVHGVISSGQNIKMIRSLVGPDFYIITPGIRSDYQKGKDDQKNTISYSEFDKIAKNDNKTFCVIGRPIYQSGNPLENLKKIINQ